MDQYSSNGPILQQRTNIPLKSVTPGPIFWEDQDYCDRSGEYYDQLLDDINMAKLMEDVDSESGSQNGLRGIDVEDFTHEKEGTMVTLERPGISGETHSSGRSYHKQTVSMFLNYSCGF